MKNYSNSIQSRVFSFFHALIVSFVAIYVLLTREKETLFNPDIIDDPFWASMFKVTCIYLLTDLIMMITYPTPGDTTFILHHIVGFIGICSIWKTQTVWLLGLFFEITEISTLFLNVTWYYVHFKLPKDTIFIFAGSFLILTFIGVRWIGGLFILYYLWLSLDHIATKALWIQIYLVFGTGTIMILNVIWGVKLLNKVRTQ